MRSHDLFLSENTDSTFPDELAHAFHFVDPEGKVVDHQGIIFVAEEDSRAYYHFSDNQFIPVKYELTQEYVDKQGNLIEGVTQGETAEQFRKKNSANLPYQLLQKPKEVDKAEKQIENLQTWRKPDVDTHPNAGDFKDETGKLIEDYDVPMFFIGTSYYYFNAKDKSVVRASFHLIKEGVNVKNGVKDVPGGTIQAESYRQACRLSGTLYSSHPILELAPDADYKQIKKRYKKYVKSKNNLPSSRVQTEESEEESVDNRLARLEKFNLIENRQAERIELATSTASTQAINNRLAILNKFNSAENEEIIRLQQQSTARPPETTTTTTTTTTTSHVEKRLREENNVSRSRKKTKSKQTPSSEAQTIAVEETRALPVEDNQVAMMEAANLAERRERERLYRISTDSTQLPQIQRSQVQNAPLPAIRQQLSTVQNNLTLPPLAITSLASRSSREPDFNSHPNAGDFRNRKTKALITDFTAPICVSGRTRWFYDRKTKDCFPVKYAIHDNEPVDFVTGVLDLSKKGIQAESYRQTCVRLNIPFSSHPLIPIKPLANPEDVKAAVENYYRQTGALPLPVEVPALLQPAPLPPARLNEVNSSSARREQPSINPNANLGTPDVVMTKNSFPVNFDIRDYTFPEEKCNAFNFVNAEGRVISHDVSIFAFVPSTFPYNWNTPVYKCLDSNHQLIPIEYQLHEECVDKDGNLTEQSPEGESAAQYRARESARNPYRIFSSPNDQMLVVMPHESIRTMGNR